MDSLSLCSLSSAIHQAKYDVFLSFRGEDTRDNFTSHLYAAFRRKQIETFIDYDGLKRGDEISPVLLQAIEQSKISVIIFSEDYASSRWCLDELAKILECKRMNGQIVIPVFYNVNPSHVRKQTGSFGDAFAKHEECFNEMTNKVQKWRDALAEAANLSGWDSSVTKPNAKLVDEIVSDILKKLKNISSSGDFEGLVGLNPRISAIKSLLCIGLLDFRIIGIWGMGGIGKTTIAGAVFNQISSQFEGCCFCINVREESEKRGLVHLRNHILSEILEENLKIGTPRIPQSIQERLRRKKVFIVLDDVNDFEQLEVLTGGLDHFGPGSRIIITTRDKQVLHSYGVCNIYEVEEFNNNEALMLFSNYTFKQNQPPEDLVKLSNSVIDYAKGNPLALKVLGSSLCRKSKRGWESAFCNLKMICDPKIHDVLKISYNGLSIEEKEIFLDIACFFKGENKDDVVQIFDGRYALEFGLSNLIDKSLITISNNKLQMHDLLQEMAREIIFQECVKEPGKRSRLWYHQDVYHVLKNNKGTDTIEGILLDMSKIKDIQLSRKAFVNMSNLRFLKFYSPKLYKVFVEISKVHLQFVDFSKVHLPWGLKYLSDELRYLHWDGYPFQKLPSKFSVENLIELRLPYSKLEQLWEGTKSAAKLKLIDLHESKCLTKIPDLSDAVVLEVMNLRYCKSLRNFPQVSGHIKELDLSGTGIKEIPTSISELKCLQRLKLWNCSKLRSFPEVLQRMKNLQYLCFRATQIRELPSSVELLNGLRELTLVDCKNLVTVPSSICSLTSVCFMNLSGCSKLDKLPENLGNLICLKTLHARRTAISELPSTIAGCKELEVLDYSICRSLVLPTVSALGSLRQINLSYCNLTGIPEDICCLSSLEVLNLSGNNFESLPTSFKQLSLLKRLWISNCKMIQSLPELPLRLVYLEARNCKKLQTLQELPSDIEELDSSEMEIAFETCCLFASTRIEFIFTNCLKLNQEASKNIMADSLLRIQHMATASLRLCYEKVFQKTPSTSFCLPGNEIPDWFEHQSSGSSVTISLPQHGWNRRFIGFAVCVVIAFERSYGGRGLYVGCSYQFQTNYNYLDPSIFGLNLSVAGRWPFTFIDSGHILLGYSPVKHLKEDYTAASFKFSPSKYGSKVLVKDCKVKSCGVCPLYSQPNVIPPSFSTEKLASKINQGFGKTMAEEHIKIRKRYDERHDQINTNEGTSRSIREEEVESYQKRICRNQINSG